MASVSTSPAAASLDEWTTDAARPGPHRALDLEAGQAYDVKLEYFENIRDAEVRLNWRQPGAKDRTRRRSTRRARPTWSIFVGGLNGEVEGEEMPVIYPGFAGGDRTEIALPKTPAEAARGAARDGQAGRAGADDGIRAGRRLGEGEPAGGARRLVSGPAGRQRHRRRAVRQGQPVRPPAGHLLQVGRQAAAVRRLFDEEPDLPVLHRRAALPVRPWPVVHAVRLHGHADRAGAGRRARRLRRVVRRAEHRHPRGPRGRRSSTRAPSTPGGHATATSCAVSRASSWRRAPGSAYRSASRSRTLRITTRRRSASSPRPASTSWRPAAPAPTFPCSARVRVP